MQKRNYIVNLDSEINLWHHGGNEWDGTETGDTRQMAGRKSWLTAAEAAEALNISEATLYAYVSRGMIRSEADNASKRTRRYHAGDIQRLRERQEQRRDPKKATEKSLHWGMPVLESGITLIVDGRYYYRGHDVCSLAEENTLEQVASLLWTGDCQNASALFALELPPLSARCEVVLGALSDASPMERFQALLPLLAADDLATYNRKPAAVAQTGARILRRMAALTAYPVSAENDLATTLQRAWVPDHSKAVCLFQTALILCADHELNVSSFTAHCVASAGSSPYAVVTGALAAFQGGKHGGASERVAAFLDEVGTPERARETIALRLKRGERIPGFGHPLYPDGDPRGKLLLERLTAAYPNSPAIALANAIIQETGTALEEYPNVDFGLATLARVFALPPDKAVALFALGRTVGWIAHALEEYPHDRLIRPRATYIGPQPSLRQNVSEHA